MLKTRPATEEDIEMLAAGDLPAGYTDYGQPGGSDLRKQYVADRKAELALDGGLSLTVVSGGRPAGIISCVREDFDSAVFGFDCYRVTGPLIAAGSRQERAAIVGELVSGLLNKLAARGRKSYLLASLSNNVKDFDVDFNLMVRQGFSYFHSMLVFGLIGSLPRSGTTVHRDSAGPVTVPASQSVPSVRLATPGDAAAVAAIAGSSFRYTRFHLDPLLDDDRADRLVSLSARNCVEGRYADRVFVAELEGRVAGFYVLKRRRLHAAAVTLGSIVSLATAREYRGRGVFAALDEAALGWLAANADYSELGTYMGNAAMQRAWIRKGLPIAGTIHQLSCFI